MLEGEKSEHLPKEKKSSNKLSVLSDVLPPIASTIDVLPPIASTIDVQTNNSNEIPQKPRPKQRYCMFDRLCN